jgi:outer membrane protein assembly factor BamE (lipoprotein component of BamABCDE complex)
MRLSHIGALITLSVLVGACEKVVMSRGYVGEFSDFDKIVIGKDREQNVFEKVGSPTASSSVSTGDGSYRWFYVAKKTEKNGFLDHKTIDQQAVVIVFSQDGVVRSVSRLMKGQEIDIVSESTESGGKTAGILSETFGGIGKYRDRFDDSKK